MEKRSKLLYWIATGFLSFGMVLGGTGQILRMKFNVEGIVHLGYPDYVLPILGTWKVMAVIVILSPNFLLAKEWAYAGLFFLLTGGAVSHFASGDGLPGALPVLLFSALTVASWYLRPAGQKTSLHNQKLNGMNPSVNWFFTKPTKWQEAYAALREIVIDCGLAEELKWGCPCYTLQQANVVLIHGFKDYCALLFMKGALLKDPKNILVQQTENVQSARQIRFTSVAEIVKMKATLKAYIKAAIEVEKAGLKVALKKPEEFRMAEEFMTAMNDMPELKAAFYNLTPGRQRGYLLHFSAPKQAKTREARIEKAIPQILDGKGLED